jgi:hypothetical protein
VIALKELWIWLVSFFRKIKNSTKPLSTSETINDTSVPLSPQENQELSPSVNKKNEEDAKMTIEYGDGGLKAVEEFIALYPNIHWSGIVLHHSLTKDGTTNDWEAIKKYHVETNGWSDIGYHLGLEKIGNSYLYRLGRPLNKPGAATKEGHQNTLSIQICCIGNYDDEEPLLCQYWLLYKLCQPLITAYKINTDNIYGHRSWATYKSCPGKQFNIQKVMDLINGKTLEELS